MILYQQGFNAGHRWAQEATVSQLREVEAFCDTCCGRLPEIEDPGRELAMAVMGGADLPFVHLHLWRYVVKADDADWQSEEFLEGFIDASLAVAAEMDQ